MKQKDLTRRYLIWCYKTTKEDLDWIDRKFTQLECDSNILKELTIAVKSVAPQEKKAYLKKIDEFKAYMASKQERGIKEKFLSLSKKELQPQYVYLQNRLKAIEKTISSFLSPKDLKTIRSLYEQEMTRRILEAREHT
ncbi:MAG: hypothetical protein P9M07_05935 [Candidatus Aceula meridiana]|nr:hypothetical protein [Candidatus Aceula meridiana]